VRQTLRGVALTEFEELYRSNVGLVTAYFARRCSEPQEVADLTSETILRAAGSFGAFDPRRGRRSCLAVWDRGSRLGRVLRPGGQPSECDGSARGPSSA
jgi:hypothetical protein